MQVELGKGFIVEKLQAEVDKYIGKTFYIVDKVKAEGIPFKVEKVIEITITEKYGYDGGRYLLKTNLENFYIDAYLKLFTTNDNDIYVGVYARKSKGTIEKGRNSYWDPSYFLDENKESVIATTKRTNKELMDNWIKETDISKKVEELNEGL